MPPGFYLRLYRRDEKYFSTCNHLKFYLFVNYMTLLESLLCVNQGKVRFSHQIIYAWFYKVIPYTTRLIYEEETQTFY